MASVEINFIKSGWRVFIMMNIRKMMMVGAVALMTTCSTFGSVPMNNTAVVEAATKKEKVALNITKKTVYEGEIVKLKVNGTKAKVTWSSSNKKVAKVSSSGKVQTINAGKVTITAKVGKKAYNCKLTVKGIKGIKVTAIKEERENYGYAGCMNPVGHEDYEGTTLFNTPFSEYPDMIKVTKQTDKEIHISANEAAVFTISGVAESGNIGYYLNKNKYAFARGFVNFATHDGFEYGASNIKWGESYNWSFTCNIQQISKESKLLSNGETKKFEFELYFVSEKALKKDIYADYEEATKKIKVVVTITDFPTYREDCLRWLKSKGFKDSLTDYEKYLWAKSILDDNITYGMGGTRVQPKEFKGCTLTGTQQVCEGQVLIFNVLLNAMGVKAEFVPLNEEDHCVSLVQVDGLWYHCDITNAGYLDAATGISSKEFQEYVKGRKNLAVDDYDSNFDTDKYFCGLTGKINNAVLGLRFSKEEVKYLMKYNGLKYYDPETAIEDNFYIEKETGALVYVPNAPYDGPTEVDDVLWGEDEE